MSKLRITLIFLFSSAIVGPVFAAGGGGGGGGSPTPSDSAPQYDPNEEYRRGFTALQAKDFKAAKIAFDRVTAIIPKDANMQYLAGLSRAGLADWKGARKNFERAVKLDPKMIGAHRELGITLAKLGDMPKAEATLVELKARAATCGGACAQAGELKAAVDAITSAMSSGAQVSFDASSSLLLATTAQGDKAYFEAVGLINEGRYEAAITSLNEAKASFGPHPDILTYLGFANRKLKRIAEAEDFYRAALTAAPNHLGATEYYGELMVERGDLPGAKRMLARLDAQCAFGCAEAEELRLWIDAKRSPHSS